MTINVDNDNNILSICGPNNVGKTNTLRALNLFFNPDIYNPKLDIPTLKKATWGGSVHPKIIVEFIEYESDKVKNKYIITRDFKNITKSGVELIGTYYKDGVKANKVEMLKEELDAFMNNIQFYFIESANLMIPDIIGEVTDNMIALEYDKARFTASKKKLRDAYIEYTEGVQGILDSFANEISGTFNKFRDSLKVIFNVPNDVQNFKDLISDDVELTIQDNGSNGIIGKGSGLQRLALIILYFELAERLLKHKNVIICIDEPDIFCMKVYNIN